MRSPAKIVFVCYYLNYLNLALSFISPFVVFSIGIPTTSESLFIFNLGRTILFIPSVVLWVYCLVFCYSNDRYSNSGIWLLIFNCIYSAYYFRNIIWKRNRALENGIAEEPVLGNKIHIETEEDEE